MRHVLAGTLWMVSALVLGGCGGGRGTTSGPPPPAQLFFDTSGNWQFTTTSTAGAMPLSIAGTIDQSVTELSGAVHINGSNCFDRLATVRLTGTLAGNKTSLTSTSDDGQVITFVGDITDTAFTGTFTINGGGANGDQGNVTGAKIPSITSQLSGAFTASGKEAFAVTAQVTQGNARSEGTFGITGTVTFGPSCFSSGTITSGTFPSGSFILGTSVALEIETDNGTLAFHGTANQTTSEISGDYTVSGSTCNQTGTAVLTSTGQWDY
jgi:hypothetical protein